MLTGLTSLVVVLAPVVLAWLVEPLSTGDGWQAAGTGAALWLLVSGAHLAIGEVTVSLVPLLGLALLVAVAWLGAREAMVDVSTDGEHWRGTLPRPLAAALGAWWAGYAVAVAAAVGLAFAGPFRVTPLSLVLPVLVVPLLALVLALRPVALDDPDVLGPRLGLAWLPDSVRRGVRPGLAGAGVLLATGLVVVIGLVALSVGRGDAPSRPPSRPAALGGVVLALAQVAALPNLALWVVSFLAGPGFRVVEGGPVTWSGSEGGLLPMVPVLAALPQPGGFPWFTALSVLVVVAVGAFVARRALAEVARLSRLRTKLAVALSACTVTALALAALDLVAGGSVGQFRLSAVGAPTGRLFLALLLELGIGALVVVFRDAWRLRREHAAHPPHPGCAGRAPCQTDPVPTDTEPLGLVVLVSGSGSNLQALLDASADEAAPFRVLAVGADRDGTGGAERAERAGIPTFVARVPDYVTRADWDLDLERLVAEPGPDLVVSAGFMKVLGPAVLGAHRVINTHPALLPSFPGAHGVRDAMAHGVKVTGCTCHWVDAGVDTGPIIDQRAVRVEPDDTVETLHERIKVVERAMLVDVVRALAADRSWR